MHWLIIGCLLRFIFMPFTLHPDILHIYYHPSFLASKGVWDIYSYQADFFKEHRYHYYPPLTYLFFGSYLYLSQPLLSGFDTFMEDVRRVTDRGGGHSGHYLTGFNHKYPLFRFLFLMKLPYLLFDLGMLVILAGFNRGSLWKWWSLNPVLLYVPYLFGQFDILPTFIILLSAYLAFKGKRALAMLALGVGAGLKNFPLFLILPLALYCSSIGKYKNFIKYIGLGLLPFLIIIFPYYFLSHGKVAGAFFSQRISERLGLKGTAGLIRTFLFLSGYLILNFSLWKPALRNRLGELGVVKIFFFTLALLFISMPISFHYFLWITPFILILAAFNRKILFPYLLAIVSLALVTLVGKNMWWGLFSPVCPEFFMGWPSLDELLKRCSFYKPLKDLAYFAFIGSLVWIGLVILKEKEGHV